MAGRTSFEYTLGDGTKVSMNEFNGQTRLHIRRYVKDRSEGICMFEREVTRFVDTIYDIDRAYDNNEEQGFEFNDFIYITCYKSGKVDFRYFFKQPDGRVLYSKKGIVLNRVAVKEMFDILMKKY